MSKEYHHGQAADMRGHYARQTSHKSGSPFDGDLGHWSPNGLWLSNRKRRSSWWLVGLGVVIVGLSLWGLH